jgi:putative thioredoxin
VALHNAASGHHKQALQQLLELVSRDKNFRDGAARKAMLKVFEIVGPRSELAEHFRTKLANALY